MSEPTKVEVLPPQKKRRMRPLTTLHGLKLEGARVYKQVARGEITDEQGRSRHYMLDIMRRVVEAEHAVSEWREIRDRLGALESRLGGMISVRPHIRRLTT